MNERQISNPDFSKVNVGFAGGFWLDENACGTAAFTGCRPETTQSEIGQTMASVVHTCRRWERGDTAGSELRGTPARLLSQHCQCLFGIVLNEITIVFFDHGNAGIGQLCDGQNGNAGAHEVGNDAVSQRVG